jgi:hypothetical protein
VPPRPPGQHPLPQITAAPTRSAGSLPVAGLGHWPAAARGEWSVVEVTKRHRAEFFHPVTVRHNDTVQATVFCIRLYDCVLPEQGVYFLVLWYDNVWVVDQRLELT